MRLAALALTLLLAAPASAADRSGTVGSFRSAPSLLAPSRASLLAPSVPSAAPSGFRPAGAATLGPALVSGCSDPACAGPFGAGPGPLGPGAVHPGEALRGAPAELALHLLSQVPIAPVASLAQLLVHSPLRIHYGPSRTPRGTGGFNVMVVLRFQLTASDGLLPARPR